ncbi:MAG TPA: hypothetical protein VHB21_05825 [Minicystis sp.]|nr:hypothetical protein [Minicystis sp.]
MKGARLALLVLFAFAALALGAPAAGCAGAEEPFVLVGGHPVDAAQIDRDPEALLPGGVVLMTYVDAAALFKTPLGPDVAELVKSLLPLGAQAGFVPERDVVRVWGGVYALQGVDFCAVVQGTFDVAAIQKAADAHAVTAFGAPLVKSRYAGFDLYTAGNVGFAIVTGRTAIAGNETGMRRALDRLKRDKLERSVLPWMTGLARTPNASLALAADLVNQPAAEGAAKTLPFLLGLKRARVVGNFRRPGVNLAGALTYPDPQTAATAATQLKSANAVATLLSWIVAGAFGGTMPPIETKQAGSDVGFTMAVDENLVRGLLRAAAGVARMAVVAR